jgi:hypothetical protein
MAQIKKNAVLLPLNEMNTPNSPTRSSPPAINNGRFSLLRQIKNPKVQIVIAATILFILINILFLAIVSHDDTLFQQVTKQIYNLVSTAFSGYTPPTWPKTQRVQPTMGEGLPIDKEMRHDPETTNLRGYTTTQRTPGHSGVSSPFTAVLNLITSTPLVNTSKTS